MAEIKSPHSRFASIGAWPARVILLVLLLLSVYGLAQAPAPVPANTGNAVEDRADVALYDTIIEGVRAGGNYHAVAAAAQREGGYPLRPFVTMRPPTLTWLLAALPGPVAARLLITLLLGAVAAAWAWRLRASEMPPTRIAIGLLLLLAGSLTLMLPDLLAWHEAWAALLIALSLALRSDRRFMLAALAGLAAVLIRELAILYPLVMAGLALLERRRAETIAWSVVIAIFAAFIAWHASEVAAVTSVADLASPGWSAAGGWGFVVTIIHLTGPLRILPFAAAAVLLPLALVGWAGWRSTTGLRGALLLAAFILLFACFGRVDNYYWGFLVAPLVPLGFLFAPQALADLARAARPRRGALLST